MASEPGHDLRVLSSLFQRTFGFDCTNDAQLLKGYSNCLWLIDRCALRPDGAATAGLGLFADIGLLSIHEADEAHFVFALFGRQKAQLHVPAPVP